MASPLCHTTGPERVLVNAYRTRFAPSVTYASELNLFPLDSNTPQ